MLLCEDNPKIWSQFLDYAEERCSATAFANWLAPIKVLHESDEGLTLEVPNVFVKEYLLENYQKDLSAFFPVKNGEELPLEFVITAPKKESSKIVVEDTSSSIIAPIEHNVKLNRNYHFENFIEGPSNQFVKSAAIGIAHKPSRSFNPLFIHGKVGLGKTHLLHAIGHSIQTSHKNLKVQCITTEAFINDLVDNLRNKSVAQMKKYYRELDVLLVDDIQFLQNRLNFEEEFCNMFETLINMNKQIVIACDKPPSHLKLSERMVARMEWGLVAHLVSPDLETRVAIIQHKAEQRGLIIPQNLAFYIAERISQNVRQIEGAVNKLSAYCHILEAQLTEEVVVEVLGEMLQHSPDQHVSIDNILKSVSQVFDVKISDLKSGGRLKNIVLPRQVAMYLAKEFVKESLTTIGSAFGKTHSTILHACKNIEQKIKIDPQLARQLQLTKRALQDQL
ncbi:MAG: Chromosomal replication initiator protein DnaA [Chlamydiae bacterium]|nr:Chromosomal replication initiator protein DnaA [Chlamydiota bacterium]